jgi:polyhydroxybutyrate depolymerase
MAGVGAQRPVPAVQPGWAFAQRISLTCRRLNCRRLSRRSVAAKLVMFAFAALSWATRGDAGCGTQPGACLLSQGSYHLELPPQSVQPVLAEQAAKLLPAVMFLHGYGGSGEGALGNKAMVRGLTERGYAVIAPDALPRREGRRSWNFFPGWEGRDEAVFLQQVAQDAAERFGLDRGEMVLAGFSAGAFMVNYLACAAPTAFAAYAPVSGGFWRPQPESCAGAVRLFHSHGWTDGVVPLEGRVLGGGQFQQGDIFAGLELWRATNRCAQQAPDTRRGDTAELRRRWVCGAGADIEFLLFSGGHRVPARWPGWMLDWLEGKDPSEGG